MMFFLIGIIVIALGRCCAIVVKVGKRRRRRRSQKIDDLPVLATRHSGTLAMVSKNLNSPVTHESIQ